MKFAERMGAKFITSAVVDFHIIPENRDQTSKNSITWTIFATLRLSFAMFSLHSLQEDLFDFAYSALNGRSSAILDSNCASLCGSAENSIVDWLQFSAKILVLQTEWMAPVQLTAVVSLVIRDTGNTPFARFNKMKKDPGVEKHFNDV